MTREQYKSLQLVQLKELAKSDERLTGDLENKTIKWMSDWDINSDDTGKTTPVELAVFQERYGGKVEFHQTTYANRYDDLANAINSDEGIDFFYGGNWDAFPKGAVRGMFVPYDDYIDLDSELWADVKDANDAMMWNIRYLTTTTEFLPMSPVCWTAANTACARLPEVCRGQNR